MFLSRLRHDPDDHLGVQPGSVSNDFSQMVVIGRFQLIFNDDLCSRCFIFCNKVAAVSAYKDFLFHIRQGKPKNIIEPFYAFRSG